MNATFPQNEFVINSVTNSNNSTPPRSQNQPIDAPWAPPRIKRTNTNVVETAIDLAEDFETTTDDGVDEVTRYVDSLTFPEIDDDMDDYQEHYTLPEEQLYYAEPEILDMEDDDVPLYPHPNITIFRGKYPTDYSEDMDILLSPSEQEDPEHNFEK